MTGNDQPSGKRGLWAVAVAGLLVLSLLVAAPVGIAQNDTNDTNDTGQAADNQTGDNATADNATDGEVVELHIATLDSGSEYWFEFEQAGDERNPTVFLPPGSHVIAHVNNPGEQVHNFHVDSEVVQNCSVEDCATELLNPGENATMEFDVPEDAPENFFYWCDPHRGQGMEGQFTTVEPTDDGNDTEEPPEGAENGDDGVPGFGAVAALAALGAAMWALQRRRR